MGVGEKFPGDGDETVVHITAVVPDAFALLRREFTEIPLQVFRGNSGQDVDDDAGFAIGDIAVVLGDIPARLSEFHVPELPLNSSTHKVRQLRGIFPTDGIQYGCNDAGRHMIVAGDHRNRKHLGEVEAELDHSGLVM